MATRLKNGGIFLHVQKTGGSWVEKVLDTLGLNKKRFGDPHSTYDRCLQEELTLDGRIPFRLARKSYRASRRLGLTVAEPPFRFCFVRHPLDWYESYFRYFAGLGWPYNGRSNSAAYWYPDAYAHECASTDFNEFMQRLHRRRPGFASELFSQYTAAGVSFIGKSEHLATHLTVALRLAGETFEDSDVHKVPRENESSLPESVICWDHDLRRSVLFSEITALTQYDYMTDELADELGVRLKAGSHEALYSG